MKNSISSGLAGTSVEDKPSNGQWVLLLVILLFATLAARIIPAWELHNEIFDTSTYHSMALTVLRGDNIYAQRVFFPYMPYTQFEPAAMLLLAEKMNWRFDFAIKLPSILMDCVATAGIFLHLAKKRKNLLSAFGWTLLWALNPVSILISSFHGNYMTVVPVFMLLAYLAAGKANEDAQRGWWLAISALMLGLAIVTRTWPIMVLPAFVFLGTRSLRESLMYGLIALFPTIASALPYLIFSRETFLAEISGYGGFPDFGWLSVFRTLPYISGKVPGIITSLFDDISMGYSRTLFLVSVIALTFLLPLFRPSSLGRVILLVPLFFYWIYGGVSAQYLIWVIPIAIAIKSRWSLIFTLVATITIIAFYHTYAPPILYGRFPPIKIDQNVSAQIMMFGNIALVAISFIWSMSIFAQEVIAFIQKKWSTDNSYLNWVKPLIGNVVYLSIVILIWLGLFFSSVSQIAKRLSDVMKPYGI